MERDGEIRLRRLGESHPFPPQNISLFLKRDGGRGKGKTSFPVKRSFPLLPESPTLVGNRAFKKSDVFGGSRDERKPPDAPMAYLAVPFRPHLLAMHGTVPSRKATHFAARSPTHVGNGSLVFRLLFGFRQLFFQFIAGMCLFTLRNSSENAIRNGRVPIRS